jgi:hypothetical protein
MQIQRNNKVLLTVLLSLILLVPLMSAATVIVKPVTNTNSTGTMNVTVTTALSSAGKYLNLTCWEDPLGGTAYVFWFKITNTSASQTWFSSPVQSISAFSDKLTYKAICGVQGDTSENSSAVTGIGIDNTAPVVSVSFMLDRVGAGNTQELTWASSDATSGLTSTLVTLSSPNSDKCPDQTWTTSSGTNVQMATEGGVANCVGTWTATISGTDKAGNVGTTTATYTAEDSSGKKLGSLDSLGSTLGTDTTAASQTAKKGISPIWLIGGAVAIYFIFFNKKKGK